MTIVHFKWIKLISNVGYNGCVQELDCIWAKLNININVPYNFYLHLLMLIRSVNHHLPKSYLSATSLGHPLPSVQLLQYCHSHSKQWFGEFSIGSFCRRKFPQLYERWPKEKSATYSVRVVDLKEVPNPGKNVSNGWIPYWDKDISSALSLFLLSKFCSSLRFAPPRGSI